MALGKIKADTLEHSTAGSLDTQYVVNGSAKVWADFNGSGTVSLNDSFNVSSLDDDGTGDYSLNFTSAMNSVNFCCTAMSSNNDRRNNADNTSTELHIGTFNSSGVAEDSDRVYGSATGDLA
jgi:hypothetical protein